MDTNEKQQLSPAERRRRMERRKQREKERRRKKRRKRILIGIGIAAAVALMVFIVWFVSNLVSGGADKRISAKGDTFVIALDPGHGGEDLGMNGAGAYEKEIDFQICSKLKIMLESQGYQVVLTREDDSRVSKEDRVSAANDSQADLLVSVHCGYSEEDASLSGALSSYKSKSKESKALAENIQEQLVSESGVTDGGVHKQDFTILESAQMPAVLVEVGYLSNDAEAVNLTEDVYQNDLAKGIAKGIILSLNRE